MTTNSAIAHLLGEMDFDPDEIRARYRLERDRRLRPEANDQYVEVTAEFSHYVDDPYVEPGFTRDPVFDEVEVAVIGAGFGGLLAAARLRQAGVESIRLVERAGDVGGTWYWNRYPGAMCDIESYIYLPLLEEMEYVPKHKYSFAPEIFEYSKAIARKFGLYEQALFQTGVSELRWDEDIDRWIITTDRNDRFLAKFVAMANGTLSRPKLPGIPGINEFKGYTFHTSRWDYGYTGGDASGNLSGLEGSGSSAPVPLRSSAFRTSVLQQSTSTCFSARRRRLMCETTARPTPNGSNRWNRVGSRSGWTTSTSS